MSDDNVTCWRINYGLDKPPHVLAEYWTMGPPVGAVLALKAACDDIDSLRARVAELEAEVARQ